MPSNRLTALLVVDLQRWFLEVGSDEKLNSVSILLKKTNELIRLFEQNNLPIFKIQTVHKADKSTWNQWAIENDVGRLIEGTQEAAYSREILSIENEIFVTKTRMSAFLRTNLETKLRNLNCNQVVICGYSTDNCVGQTSIDAYEYDFKVVLAKEAILGTNLIQGNLMLNSLRKRFGIIPINNDAIKDLLEKLQSTKT